LQRNFRSVAVPATEAPSSKIKKNFFLDIISLFKNVSFQRTLLGAAMVIISFFLLAYSFIFVATFEQLNNTTSFFPWAWHSVYTTYPPVELLFYTGAAISEILFATGGILLCFYFPLKRSLPANSSNITH
jgi:uncharacterized membrane protein